MWLSSSTISHSACTRCSASIARSIADNDLGGHQFGRGLHIEIPAFLARVPKFWPETKIPKHKQTNPRRGGENPDGAKKEPRLGGNTSRGPPESQGGQGIENLGAPSIAAIRERSSLLA